MSGWSHDDPGAGSTAFLRTTAVNLEYLASGLEQAGAAVAADGEAADQPALWSGAACEAWQVRRDELVAGLAPVAEAMGDYHTALVAYADEVEDIAGWAQRYQTRKADAEQDLADATRALLTLPTTPLGRSLDLGGGPSPAQRITLAERELADVKKGLDELVDRREAADRALVEALVPLSVGDWAELGRTMSESGFTRPDQLTDAALAAALADAFGSVLAGGTSALTQAWDLLAAWGDSPAVMDALFEQLGGAGTAAVVDVLGHLVEQGDSSETALALALALRGGLARTAGSWDADRVAGFADELMAASHAGGVITFLFDDWQNPMPEGLTVAMADRVDAFERTYGADWWNAESSGAAALVRTLHPDDPRYGVDPGGAVLGTLGQHPDAATDWLLDSELSTTRVAYWYGLRDGGLPRDGFAGVGALWEGIFHVQGGLDDPATADIGTLTRWADLTSLIMATLNDNESWRPGNLSPGGAAGVAGAIGEMLPLISQVPMKDEDEDYEFGEIGSVVGASVVYGREVAFPFFDKDVLARLLGIATTQESGVLAYGAGVAAAIDRNLGALDPAAPTYGEDANNMLGRVAAMLGLADGAQVGANVSEAVRRALAEQEFWSCADFVGGFASVDFSGLSRTAAAAASVAATLAQGAAQSALAPADPIEAMRAAVQEALLADGARDDAARRALVEVAAQVSTAFEQATGAPPDPVRMADRVDGAMAGYGSTRGDFAWNALTGGLS